MRPATSRSALVQLIAAVGLGFDEVPADLLAEAMADSGMYLTATADALEQTLARFRQPQPDVQPLADLLFLRYDPLAMVQRADAELLRRARDAAHGLSGFGAIYLLHALLMPDTPGLAAFRALIDELGIAQILINMSRAVHTTRGFVDILVACLHPMYQAVHGYLSSQLANGPQLFHGSDDEHTAAKFMADWIAAIQSITPGAGHGAADGPPGKTR